MPLFEHEPNAPSEADGLGEEGDLDASQVSSEVEPDAERPGPSGPSRTRRRIELAEKSADARGAAGGAGESEEETEGEELFDDDMEKDYRPIPALDVYESEGIDEAEYSDLSVGDRMAAERELDKRDRDRTRVAGGHIRRALLYGTPATSLLHLHFSFISPP